MADKERRDFCIECRKNTEYTLQKRIITKTIKDKTYQFRITAAICSECGEEMSIPGLIDKNIKEVDEQYRAASDLVTIEDIEKLMKIYRIGKAPLSLALGFGEVTITRYLAGQIPSKEYSDIIKEALTSPSYMKKMLTKSREKIADAAYKKALEAAIGLENLFSVSDKLLRVISYVFAKLGEVTPLMLQKLLYFIQGIYLALYGKPLFAEDCEAWVHGPVFPDVYNLFKDFKYNPIEDPRFAILDGTADKLTAQEQRVIDLVVGTFGLYSGKVLERITHNEIPWKDARRGCGDTIPSNQILKKDTIAAYYTIINHQYDISTISGLKEYIRDMLEGKRQGRCNQ